MFELYPFFEERHFRKGVPSLSFCYLILILLWTILFARIHTLHTRFGARFYTETHCRTPPETTSPHVCTIKCYTLGLGTESFSILTEMKNIKKSKFDEYSIQKLRIEKEKKRNPIKGVLLTDTELREHTLSWGKWNEKKRKKRAKRTGNY